MSNPNDFRPGVTDRGPPRAAKGGFPYPGHGTMADQRLKRESKAEYDRRRYLATRKKPEPA